MAELKPCPFCGGVATVIRTYTDDRQYQVFCGCGGRVAYFDTEEEAIEAWNKRANQSPCDYCKFNPPSSMDGKPCSMCVAEGSAIDFDYEAED